MLDLPRGIQPVHPWHRDIHSHDVGVQKLSLLDRIISVTCFTTDRESGVRGKERADTVHLGLARDRVRRSHESEIGDLRRRFRSLTQRERDVVTMAASGALNKDIADRLGISENTVKAHRDRAMDKIQARSLAELVKIIERLAASSALRDTG